MFVNSIFAPYKINNLALFPRLKTCIDNEASVSGEWNVIWRHYVCYRSEECYEAVSPVKSVYHRAISCVLTLAQSTCVTAAPNNCSPQQLNMTQLLVIVSLLSLRYGFKIFLSLFNKTWIKIWSRKLTVVHLIFL